MTAIHDPTSAYLPQLPLHVSPDSKPLRNDGEKQLTGEEQKLQSSQPFDKLLSECTLVDCKTDSESEDKTSGSNVGTENLQSKRSCGRNENMLCPAVGPPKQKLQTVTIVVTNGKCGGGGGDGGGGDIAHSFSPLSASSMDSSSCQGSADQSSSSPSSYHDVSITNSSCNSHAMLEQVLAGLPEEKDNPEVVRQLLEHIVTLKLELEELKQENQKLYLTQTAMDDEIHTLTENLFEEAYRMVDTAKEEKGTVIKRLADATGKMDAMETQMSALKNLLQQAPADVHSKSKTAGGGGGGGGVKQHRKHHRPNVKKVFRKLSRKVKSASSMSASNFVSTSHPLSLLEHRNEIKGACLNEGQLVPGDLSWFTEWLSESVDADHPYLLYLEETDVKPCLDFRNKEISLQVLLAARRNDLIMESVGPCSEGEIRLCALSEYKDVGCTHRMKLGSSHQWLFISQHCRNRIVAACDFYMYIGHIERGIVKAEAPQLYWQVARLRAMMNLARLSLELPD